MPEPTATPAPETPATPENPEVSLAPTATPAEHMIPKVRLDEEISKRKDLEKQIKDLAKTQAEGSDAKKKLEEMGAQLEKTERRATFLEDAMNPAIQCKNARAAWVLAEAENLFDRKGAPDWAAIKAAAPELFGATVANANAAQNTKQAPAPHASMNNFIRTQTGRK